MGNNQSNRVSTMQNRRGFEDNDNISIDLQHVGALQENYYSNPNPIEADIYPDHEAFHANKTLKSNAKAQKNLSITIDVSTWYRDSHGLFDYEEHEKVKLNEFKTMSSCK